MELNAIKSKGNWGEMAADLNANFAAVTAELEKLKATNVKFKGYFTSEKTLMASFPSPSPGDTAWVGEVYPGTVYECKATGAWSNTGKIPSTPSVQLADYARKELVNSRTTEYNVSVQHPTSGTGGTNSYTLEAAIVQVPPELRNIGLKVSFINSDGKVETWEYGGGTFTTIGNWVQGGGNKMEAISHREAVGRYENMLLSNIKFSRYATFKYSLITDYKSIKPFSRTPGLILDKKLYLCVYAPGSGFRRRQGCEGNGPRRACPLRCRPSPPPRYKCHSCRTTRKTAA